jgi:hypothetical protein
LTGKIDGHFTQISRWEEGNCVFAYNYKKQLLYKVNNKGKTINVFYDDIFINSSSQIQFKLFKLDSRRIYNGDKMLMAVVTDTNEISILGDLQSAEAEPLLKIPKIPGNSIKDFTIIDSNFEGTLELIVLSHDKILTLVKLDLLTKNMHYKFSSQFTLKLPNGQNPMGFFRPQNKPRVVLLSSFNEQARLWHLQEVNLENFKEIRVVKAFEAGRVQWAESKNGLFGVGGSEGYYVDFESKEKGSKVSFEGGVVSFANWESKKGFELWVLGDDGAVKKYE